MQLARWIPVRKALDDFRTYLAPHIPDFDLLNATDAHWTEDEYRRLRPKGFPTRLCGVYLLFDEAELLQYVGVAVVNFDKRVWSHDTWIERRWIDIIPIRDEFVFLAPSLEYFLICRLAPRHNKSFNGHTIPKCSV